MDPRHLRRSAPMPSRPTSLRGAPRRLALAMGVAFAFTAAPGPVLAAGTGARLPDTTPPARVAAPRFVPHHEVERLEILGRTDPDAAVTELERWLESHPAGDLQRLEALMALGADEVVLMQADEVERVARLIDGMVDAQPLARPAAMVVRANGLTARGEHVKAERLLIEASALLPADTPSWVRLGWLSTSALVKKHTAHYDDAVRRYHEAIVLVDNEGGPDWRALDLRVGLAGTLMAAGQYGKVRELHRELETLANGDGDELTLGSLANERGIMDSDEARDAKTTLADWQAAIEHSRLAGARRALVLNLANIADYYISHGDFETALEVSQRALPMARDLHSENGQSVALGNIGLALIALHRKDEAQPWLREAAAIDERMSTSTEIANNLLEIGGFYERAGYLADALQAYRQSRQVLEASGQQDRQRGVLELQETFANERREHELGMLAREGKLKDEEIRHHDLQVKEWTAAGIASLLMAGVLALLARRMRLRNQQLSVSNEALRIQAERDPLTGLANRHFLQAVMASRDPSRGLEGTLYLLDVDHFKHINDRCGHAGGDTVLIEIAHRLRETLRGDDLIVRWGGEEFLVLVKPLPVGESEALAQRLLTCLAEKPVMFEGKPVPVSASIGYGQFPLTGAEVPVDWERAISLVDTAMYLSKAHGRNCATGIRRVEAVSVEDLDVLTQTLESAWREGRADLHLQYGPAASTAHVPPTPPEPRGRESTAAVLRETVQ